MSNNVLFNKIGNIKNKKILIQIAKIVINDKINFISNDSGFGFNPQCLSSDAINKLSILLNNYIENDKIKWYTMLNKII